MADRTTKVIITAQVQQYIDGMEKAAQATRATGTEAERLAQKRDAFNLLGASALAMGAAAAAGVGLAISKWADFDQAMSNVQAATHESAANMDLLSKAALDAGARTVFSAEESANAIEELAKAGVSTADILNGALDGALDLAAAGGLGVAEAAGIAATALKTFKLEGSDMAHVADLLAAGAGKAMGDVTDLSAALNQSSMVANATGLSIEETTAGLAAFASQGLIGSDAGTSFKAMLQSLTPTSGKAAETMAELGISAYDSQGNFIGLAEFAGNLRDSLKDLTVEQQQAALKTIFGSDAIRAATVLYSEGEKGIRDWTEAVDDQGYAAETAAARLDNLKGDIEALGGALDTALIESGSASNDVMRGLVQAVSGAVDAYNALPAPLQGAALAAGALTAAVGLGSGAIAIAIPKIAEYKAAMIALELSGGRLERTLSAVGRVAGLGLAAGVATVGINALADDLTKKLSPSAEETTNAVLTSKSAVEAFAGAMEARAPGGDGYFDTATRQVEGLGAALDAAAKSSFWDPIDPALDEYLGTWRVAAKEIASLAKSDLPAASDQFMKIAEGADLSREQMSQLITESDDLRNALIGQASAAELGSEESTLLALAMGEIGPAAEAGAAGTKGQADALDGLGVSAEEVQAAISDLADEIRGFGDTTFDMREANRALEDSYLTLADSLEANGGNFDISSEAGRQNEAALDGVARATNDAAAAILVQTGSQEQANAKLEEGRQKLIDILAPTYGSRDAAAAYVDQLNLISPQKVTDILLQGANEAMNTLTQLDAFKFAPKVLTVEEQFFRNVMYKNPGDPSIPHANGGIHAYANGGINEGIYSGGEPLYKFAEQETGWEALISGKPSERERNRQIWSETGNRLGMAGAGQSTVYVPTSLKVYDADNKFIGTMGAVADQKIDAANEQKAREQRKAGQ